MGEHEADEPRSATDILAEYVEGLGGAEVDVEALCARHPQQADELRERVADWRAMLEDLGGASAAEDPRAARGEADASGTIRRLRERGKEPRYEIVGEFARGGMGAILRVWDRDFRRNLAMKVVLGSRQTGEEGTPGVDEKTLGRFVEEAQVTGQLDHPGIVPVHELGLDEDGQVFFTMRLVKGDDLKTVFELLRAGEGGWTQTRVLGVLLKVCEAMAYAHSKHVIHRDLKPANVMVGRFGEAYVMDWGLAHVAGQEDKKDIRVREPEAATLSSVHTDRREESDADSPLLTMDGDIVGTPAYMSPEQARGDIAAMGPSSDVYSLGAILYQLLAGHMPYVPADANLNAYAIWAAVQQGSPTPIGTLAPDASGELVAICEKAMRRDPAARYADMGEMAEDLRAFMEGRVVKAHRTGVVVEVQKWVARNRALAAAVVVAVLVGLAGLASTSYVQAKSRTEKRVTERLKTMAQHATLVGGSGEGSVRLEERANELWPPHPEKIAELGEWLADARELAGFLPEHRARFRELDGRAGKTAGEQWEHDVLGALVAGIERLESGLLAEDAVLPDVGWSVPKLWSFAQELEERSAEGGEWDARWNEAIEAIRIHPDYGGLVLEKQTGLVPLGTDPGSRLWEFWHVASGEEPVRREGRLVVTGETGIVLVLIPAGEFLMGAQHLDPAGPQYDPRADLADPSKGPNEKAEEYDKSTGLPVEVPLDAYFLSKYEMTQGQWFRIRGTQPSFDDTNEDGTFDEQPYLPARPVNSVTWTECDAATDRFGLDLPHEEQWEYAARAGSTTIFSTKSDDPASLAGYANIRSGRSVPRSVDVDSLLPNDWGLHGIHGNVIEWCSNVPYEYGDPDKAAPLGRKQRSARGGCIAADATQSRCSRRLTGPEERPMFVLGLRPARAIERRDG